ncbi:hypothetical protein OROHE_022621 [Orobanche hederae]
MLRNALEPEVALKLLRDSKDGFDIVMSDVHMPDMDGFKLLEHVGLEMDLPVISDDIVLIEETKVGVQQKLELWRDTLEARGFRLSRSKTEYMECRFSDNNDREAGMITFDGKVVHGSAFFRYLGSIIQKDGELDGDVAHRIKAG